MKVFGDSLQKAFITLRKKEVFLKLLKKKVYKLFYSNKYILNSNKKNFIPYIYSPIIFWISALKSSFLYPLII
jgi:hypothetical protein